MSALAPLWRRGVAAGDVAPAVGAAVITACALALSTLACVWPFLSASFLPFVDYPQHLATIAAIHGQDDPSFASYFWVSYGETQYLAFYVGADWLAHLVGVERASAWLTMASVASLPFSLACFLRAHSRPALLAAAVAPIGFNAWLFWGFVNFTMAMPLALLALAVGAGLLRADARGDSIRRMGTRAFAFAVLAALTFYTHAQVYAWMALAATVQAAFVLMNSTQPNERRPWRGLAWSAAASVPSIVAALLWVRASGVVERGEAGGRGGVAPQVASGAPQFAPLLETLRGFADHTLNAYPIDGDEWLLVGFLLALVLGIALRGRATSGGDVASTRPAGWAPEAVFVVTLACYLFTPHSYRLIQPINDRFAPLVLATALCLGPLRLDVRARVIIVIASVGLAVGTARLHADRFAAYEQEMGDLDSALGRTVAGRRLLGLVHDRGSGVTNFSAHLHDAQYYQAKVGGLAEFSFAEFAKSPIHYRDGAAPPVFPPRFEWSPERFEWQRFGPAFDYFLARRVPGTRPDPFGSHASEVRLLHESERWLLWERATR